MKCVLHEIMIFFHDFVMICFFSDHDFVIRGGLTGRLRPVAAIVLFLGFREAGEKHSSIL